MCYSTVGWLPPACAPTAPPYRDYAHMSHIKQALSRTLAFVKFPCALRLSLFRSHALTTGSTFVSSPLILLHHHRESGLTFCALSVPLGLLMRKILPCLIPVQLSSPRLILPVRGACVQPRSMIILLYRVRTDAHSPRMETRSPRLHPPAIMRTSPPFLPPLFPPSHPAAAGRPDSHRFPRYCWPGGSPTSLKRSMGEYEIWWTQYHLHDSQKSRKDIFSVYVNKLVIR